MQQCRVTPGKGSGKGWIGEQGDASGLMGLSGRGDPGKGKSFEM